MRTARSLALTALLLAALSGCASTTAPSTSPSGSAGPDAKQATAAFTQRAGTLASGWDGSPVQQTWEAGYVPADDGVHLAPGAWHSEADKAAYKGAKFRYAVPMPMGPAQQTIHFASGTQRTLPGLTPQEAMRTESLGRCPKSGCPTTELTVTSAKATTEQQNTSQGMATVPAWAVTIAGYQGDFVFPAVHPEELPEQPIANLQNAGYQGARLVSVSQDGRTLTLQVVDTCGHEKPTGLLYETKDVVVVGATDVATGKPITSCAEAAVVVRTQVHLGDALAGRSVLNVLNGAPEFPQG
ncbi:hypothetical protein [Streptacidiphilus jiangxiensis]|uniref:Lipoprotein n=1 Tax=Streptacidiphilus jiangxiensis TaxID=235985 RepID=A0A1H7SLC6_STRJI|nr:hypothetical protein [Streptacidiphilus jiangxiensis]SEL72524.1 hypothetical protein SAMN05414137_11239 [Streptacidiphilus jiangxiensis]